jgi:DNA-binding Lrp family transcriptional regulator
MKAQDIVVLLKILILDKKPWTMTELANSLGLSQSEISKSIKRLTNAKIYTKETRSILRNTFYEVLIYGVPYFFPTETGKITRGTPTFISHDFLKNKILSDSTYVWPDDEGKIKGETVPPLYPGIVHAAKNDKDLHLLLALIDALRIGKTREKVIARAELKKRIVDEQN